MLPIGGAALAPEQTARMVRMLEPTVVVPVHYDPPAGSDDALAKFLGSVGVDPEEPVARASIQHRGLGEQLRVVLLEPRG